MALKFNNLLNPYFKRWEKDEENRKSLDNFYEKNPQFSRTATIPTQDNRVRGLINPPSIPSLPSTSNTKTSSYDFYKGSNSSGGIFSPSAFAKYSEDNPNTPDLIKPIGFALESPFRVPFVNRLTKAITGDSGLATNAPVNTYSTDTRNNFLNGTADVVGGIAGFGLKPRLMGANGVNLMAAGDSAAKFTADNIAAKLGNNMTSRVASSIGRGVVDGAVGNVAYDMAMNKDIKDLPKSALIGAVGGASLMGGGKLAGEGINKLKFPELNFGNLDTSIAKTDYTPNTEVLNTKGVNTLDNVETPVKINPGTLESTITKTTENNTSILQNNFPIGSKVSYDNSMSGTKGNTDPRFMQKGTVIGYKTDKWGNEWAEIDTGVKDRVTGNNVKTVARIEELQPENGNKSVVANTTSQPAFNETHVKASEKIGDEVFNNLDDILAKGRKNAKNELAVTLDENVKSKKAPLDTKAGKITRTEKQENFSKWFGESKVLDKNGKPRPVYHGTSNYGFTKFEKDKIPKKGNLMGSGFYFTESKATAEGYAKKGSGENSNAYKMYLNIKHPFDADSNEHVNIQLLKDFLKYLDDNNLEREPGVEKILRQKRGHTPYFKEDNSMFVTSVASLNNNAFRDFLQSKGYDGITHVGGYIVGGRKHRVWIAFEPNQIKSATHNSGAYGLNVDDFTAATLDDGIGESKAKDIRQLIKEHYSSNSITKEGLVKKLQDGGFNEEDANILANHIEKRMSEEINNNEMAAAQAEQVKESKFKTNTWENSPFMADEATQKMVKDIDATYDVQTNEENLQVAMYRLNKDFDGVVERITKEGIQTAEDSVASGLITNRLIQEAKTTGNYSKVSQWLKVVRPEVTNLAQSLQALSTWKRLTPEGTLLKAQKVVDTAIEKVKKENPKKFKEVQKQIEKNPGIADEILKKNKIPQLTNDDIKFITDQMNKIEKMEEGRAKDVEFAKVKQLMADKIVPTFTDKIKATQRISLLLNTKTMTRNILGNVVMSGLENTKDIPGATIDKLISKTTGKRTTLMPSIEGVKTQVKGGVKGAKETIEDFKLGINTNPAAGQYELPSSQAFKGGVMGKLEKVTNAGLTMGDRPFWQGAYDDALRQQLKINKVTEPTEKIIKQATDIANERTFQNTNALVKGFKDIQKALNLGKDFGLGNIVIPFTKTPANILDKAIDYSPIGGMKGVYNLINGLKKGTLNQKQVVDQLGRGITGSTLMAIGYAMAKKGVLTGQANKDKDVAALEKQAGKSPYAVKTGDTYRTIDWMQPAAIPLMIGADIFHQGKNEKDLQSVIANAVVSGGNTLFNQSLLQGIQKFFNTSYTSSGGIMENIGNTLMQSPTQFVPSALKEVNQLIDNKQRDTSGGVVDQIKAKIPGLAQTLPVKYDTMGREMKTYKNGNNLWNVGFNPGFTTKYNPSDGEKAALDIFEENGNKTQFPQVMDNKITYTDSKTGKKAVVNLTPKEKQEFQKAVGQKVESQFKYIHGGTTEDKVKDMEKILRDIKKEEQDKILKNKGLSRK